MPLDRKRRWGKFSKERDGDGTSSESEGEPFLSIHKSESSEEDSYGPSLPAHLKLEALVAKNPNESISYCIDVPSHYSQQSLKTENRERQCIGPALPPSLPNKIREKSEGSNVQSIGPTIPLCTRYEGPKSAGDNDFRMDGPMLPPNLLKKLAGSDQQTRAIGPTMPSHLKQRDSPVRVEGPCLPAHLMPSTSRKILGPDLPPGYTPVEDSSDDSDEDTNIGPDPRLMVSGEQSGGSDFDERAVRAKRKLLGLDKEEKKGRESWMLELPPERAANIGLGPRQFRQKLAPDLGDRSVWTDTPSDTIRKEKLPPKLDDKAIIRKNELAERDRMMEKLARKAEKKLKREESLLDMHTKKLKNKAKKQAKEKEGQPKERKRFNREEDLQVNRFDEAQKKAIFKRAQLLNDRFSSGESKYL